MPIKPNKKLCLTLLIFIIITMGKTASVFAENNPAPARIRDLGIRVGSLE